MKQSLKYKIFGIFCIVIGLALGTYFIYLSVVKATQSGIGGNEDVFKNATFDGKITVNAKSFDGFSLIRDSSVSNSICSFSNDPDISGVFTIQGGEGTQTTPLPASTGKRIGMLSIEGYRPGGFAQEKAIIELRATEDYTATANGSKFVLGTTDIGSAVREDRVEIDEKGLSILNQGTLNIKEMAGTPIAEPEIMKIYSKSDNNLYFQDGNGNENVVLAKNPEQDLTISSGAITVQHSPIIYVVIDTENGDANDDLDTINGGEVGDLLVLQTIDAARNVRVRNLIGNINTTTPVNFILNVPADKFTLIKSVSGNWDEFSRSLNNN